MCRHRCLLCGSEYTWWLLNSDALIGDCPIVFHVSPAADDRGDILRQSSHLHPASLGSIPHHVPPRQITRIARQDPDVVAARRGK